MKLTPAIGARWVQWPWQYLPSAARSASAALGVALAVLPVSVACSGSAEPAAEPRYPEKRRPPPLRSASDGEIMGADRISPEDRLEASPTNEHPAKGWVVEDGKLMPEKEAQHREAAHERAGYAAEPKAGSQAEPDCDPTPGAAPVDPKAAGDGRKRKPPCPPPPQQR